MKPEEFCYWLQGYFEMSESKTLDERQVEVLKNHLNLVFTHSIDPSYLEGLSPQDAEKKKVLLDSAHAGKPQYPTGKTGYLPTFRC